MVAQNDGARAQTILILGTGIAGLSAALKFAKVLPTARIVLVSKSDPLEGSTRYAQGGIAAVWSAEDRFESHEKDTFLAGAGLCHSDTVHTCVTEGPERVRELIELGVEFTQNEGGFDLHREGGHSERRILHSHDLTGLAIETILLKRAKAQPNIEILDHHVAIDLITEGKIFKRFRKPGRCLGAYLLNARSGEISTLGADITVLASGGAGKVYLYTSNPDVATGDGIAMAVRAGARVANLEFMQFHPTCLYLPGHAAGAGVQARTFLITEALRGEGAILRNLQGEDFMPRFHPQGSLAPRDHVARAIDMEMKRSGDKHVWLDCSNLSREDFAIKFPHILEICTQFGFSPPEKPIPVVPAAHYLCGGVVADLQGRSTIEGLYAIGEVACTGLHGANRLASNSLLEAVVFAHRAVEHATQEFLPSVSKNASLPPLPKWETGLAVPLEERIDIAASWSEIRQLMWNYVGIVRTEQRLERARRRLDLLHEEVTKTYWNYLLTPELVELRNLLLVAQSIVRCASLRKESRGLHFNADFPELDDVHFKHDTVL